MMDINDRYNLRPIYIYIYIHAILFIYHSSHLSTYIQLINKAINRVLYFNLLLESLILVLI